QPRFICLPSTCKRSPTRTGWSCNLRSEPLETITMASASLSVESSRGQPCRWTSTLTPLRFGDVSRQCFRRRTDFSYSCVPLGWDLSSSPAISTTFLGRGASAPHGGGQHRDRIATRAHAAPGRHRMMLSRQELTVGSEVVPLLEVVLV